MKTQFSTPEHKNVLLPSELLQPFPPVKAEIHTNVHGIRHRKSPSLHLAVTGHNSGLKPNGFHWNMIQIDVIFHGIERKAYNERA